METDAIVALRSLDRASPEHVLPGTIKLTEDTLSRLAHLLKSGCSIQLACDEVRTNSLLSPPQPPIASFVVLRLTILPSQIGVSRTSFYRWVDRARAQDAPQIYYEWVQIHSETPNMCSCLHAQVCCCSRSNARPTFGAVFRVHSHACLFPVSQLSTFAYFRFAFFLNLTSAGLPLRLGRKSPPRI